MYNAITDLPPEVREHLTPDEQARWLTAFNSVLAQTGDEEKAWLAAWGTVRKGRAARTVALRQDGDELVIVRGWGLKFTNPADPDLYGEHFSHLTTLLADFYGDAPLWYEHGMDSDYGYLPIGRRARVEIYGWGIWAEHTLFPDHPLYERTVREIREGRLSYSSDSIAHHVEAGFNLASGELRAWPLAGWSLTQHPAEPGLGPVTLDGLAATIEEVVAAPSKRYELDGGRATVTVTASRSVYGPPGTAPTDDGATPADEIAASDSEAREAQGDGTADLGAEAPVHDEREDDATEPVVPSTEHDQGVMTTDAPTSPDGASDSAPDDETPTDEIDIEGEGTMDPEMLASLAQFLGVDATPEAVATALRDLIAALEGGEQDGAESAAPMPDAGAVRSALDMEDGADNSAVIEALRGMLALLDAPAHGGYDYGALRAARRRFDALADQTPVTPQVPYRTREMDMDDEDDEQPPSGNGVMGMTRTPSTGRSLVRRRAPAFNRGVTKPGVAHAVLAALGVMPPGFRGTLTDARRHLFRTDRAAKVGGDDGPRGGWVLNAEIAGDILEPLRSSLVLLDAGATYMPMNGIDTLTIRKMVGVPGAYWAAEGTEVEGDEASWATATLTLKELRAPNTWPNRWLRNLAPGAESMIRDQMVKSMRLKMEYSALFGSGGVPDDDTSTGIEPLGVRYTPGVTVATLSPERALTLDDLRTAHAALEDNDVEEGPGWGWVSHPRTFRTFEYMTDENGLPILRDSWDQGVRNRALVDFPYYKTTGVPKTLGAGTATTLFFGDWQELVIGMGMDVELVVSEHRYIEKNSTFVMAVAYVDTAVMRSEAFHVTTGVL